MHHLNYARPSHGPQPLSGMGATLLTPPPMGTWKFSLGIETPAPAITPEIRTSIGIVALGWNPWLVLLLKVEPLLSLPRLTERGRHPRRSRTACRSRRTAPTLRS